MGLLAVPVAAAVCGLFLVARAFVGLWNTPAVAVDDDSAGRRKLRTHAFGDLGIGGLALIIGLSALARMSSANFAAPTPAAEGITASDARPGRVTVDLDRRDAAGTTALMRAARSADAETIIRLLAAGADPNHVDRVGRTALDYAVTADSEPAVHALLTANPFLSLQDRRGETVLHLAAEQGAVDITRELLNAGADPTAVDARGRTPLALARASSSPGSAEVAEMLKRATKDR